MKKKHVILLIAIIVLLNPFSWFKDKSKDRDESEKEAQEQPYRKNTYLVNECSIINSENCTIYKYSGRGGR